MYYNIWDQNRTCGKAELKAEGMYYLAKCICNQELNIKKTVYLSSRGNQIKIGLLAPEGDKMAVQKRVRKDQLDLLDLRFFVAGDTADFEVEEDAPFQKLAWIKNMRLSKGGKFILQQQALNTQDNDQIP